LRPLFLSEKGANAARSPVGARRSRSAPGCGPTQARKGERPVPQGERRWARTSTRAAPAADAGFALAGCRPPGSATFDAAADFHASFRGAARWSEMASVPEATPQERLLRYNNGAVLLHWLTALIV